MTTETNITQAKQPATLSVKPSLAATQKLAKDLEKFVKDNKLSSNIAGKNYVQVEGWEFAGSQLGLTAIPVDLQDISTDSEIKYKATTEIIHMPTGNLISRGFAICSNKEASKRAFAEYAVASMAQTRSIGKAYRNNLSWLMKLAGFEATPKEEITEDLRDQLKEELSKTKATVFARFKELGVDDSSKMLDIIRNATGKQTIDNSDDAEAVIKYLNKED